MKRTHSPSRTRAMSKTKTRLLPQIIRTICCNAEVVKDAQPFPSRSSTDEFAAFDLSQFVNDDSVHQLSTPGLILDEPFSTSPYDATPLLDFNAYLPTTNEDFASLFPSCNTFPDLQNATTTCSPQELGLNSPPFGLLNSPPATSSDLLDQEEVLVDQSQQEVEEEVGRGKRKRKESKFTGFRNTSVQPIAIDAPIAARNYVLPSATSRKEVPVLIQRQIKKRKLGKKEDAAVLDAMVDVDVPGAADGLDKEIVDAIAQKRLQNTVAARRSRQRKQEELQRLKDERDEWKERCQLAEARLAAAGL